ncbi:MAG: hypothetical protein RLZZ385_1770 [Pseudomonadota bacterium]|jgi:hypothetical protein
MAMFSTFLFSARMYVQLCAQSLSRRGDLGRLSLAGRLLRLLVFMAFFPVWLIHWVGLLLDEVLFRGYRNVEVRQPVFILGVPRSGTTFLHRTLAADTDTFTTLSTWEVFFAPSVTQRMFWRGIGRLDGLLGSPFKRLLQWAEARLFKGLEGVHEVSLEAAEEDYLLLLPILSCFILFLPFTESPYIWRLSRFDWDMPAQDRRRIMDFYKACLQKHLYFHGAQRRFLSKNASFASWTNSLHEQFPDASFVICLREPEKAVPSLIGSLESGARLFELDLDRGELPQMLIAMMRDFYRHLLTEIRPRAPLVHMADLQSQLEPTVVGIYQDVGIPMSDTYLTCLRRLADEAGRYRSKANHITPKTVAQDQYFVHNFPWYYELAGSVTPTNHLPQSKPKA